jgi:hypothetical protein
MKSHLYFLRPRTPPSIGLWLVVLILLGSTAGLIHRAWLESGRVRKLDVAISSRQDTQKRGSVPRKSSEDVMRIRHWNELRGERNFPWAGVFDAVERSDRSNIELLELRPEKANRSIIIRGEALDRDALAAYLEILASQQGFRQAHLLRMQFVKREKIATVSFEIKASIR